MTPAQAGAEDHWLTQADRFGASHWLGNVSGRVERLALGECDIPLVLPCPDRRSSYVASPASAWVHYPHDELKRHGGVMHALAAPLVAGLSGWARAGSLHRAASLGNWLVSTNLHAQASDAEWRRARDAALVLAPDRPLLIRNVSPEVNPDLMRVLVDDGWCLAPARRVYVCNPDDPGVARRNNVKNDRRALNKAHFERLDPAAMRDEAPARLRRLFRQLFIDKHSALNPDFTEAFFSHCQQGGLLDLHGLRHDGRVVGVVGFLRRHGWLTSPLLGYDTQAPKSLGVYRALMALSFEEARSAGVQLHLSSGAGEFKQARGGVAVMEYNALYLRHLPRRTRVAALGFSALMRGSVPPVLRRFG